MTTKATPAITRYAHFGKLNSLSIMEVDVAGFTFFTTFSSGAIYSCTESGRVVLLRSFAFLSSFVVFDIVHKLLYLFYSS
jgi:hypothetical protein